MGHADYSNISKFMKTHLLKVPASIAQMQEAFSKEHPKDGVRASEGVYNEDFMIRNAMQEIVGFWRAHYANSYSPKLSWTKNPVVVPKKLEGTQGEILDCFDGEDELEDEEEIAALDAIVWAFAPSWKRKQKDIPLLGQVSH